MDQRFLDAAGVGANELKGFVATGATDEEITSWIEEHAHAAREKPWKKRVKTD